MTDIKAYIQNQLNRAPLLLKSLVQDEKGKPYIQRKIILRMREYIKNFNGNFRESRLIIIPGLRGVGKTTLLAQLYFELTAARKEVLYLSVDEIVNLIGSNLYTALKEYERVLGTSFEGLDRDVFLLIDEVHFDKQWQAVLKSVFDKSRRVFVICTGSSALSLQSTPDLARRSQLEKMYPMNFTESLLMKSNINPDEPENNPVSGLDEEVAAALFEAVDGADCYRKLAALQSRVNEYWKRIDPLEIDAFIKRGTLPFALRIKDESAVYQRTMDVLDKVISADITDTTRLTPETVSKIRGALLILASNDETVATNMARSLEMRASTLLSVLEALERAEIVLRIFPFGSTERKIRKPSKYCFGSPLLRLALLSVVDGSAAFEKNKGRLLEDLVAATLYRRFGGSFLAPLQYDAQKGGADFVVSLKNRIIVEVGWGEKGNRQVFQSLTKVRADYGLTISDTDVAIDETGKMIKVPLNYFLLI